MKIALIQTNTGRNQDANILALQKLLEKLPKVDLVITPECTNIMGYNQIVDELMTAIDDPMVEFCRSWAKSTQTNFLIGSALLRDGEKPVNRQLLINTKGEITKHYDKIHMFDVTLPDGQIFRESDRFEAGSEAVISQLDHIVLGHAICFDLRFAALFNTLAHAGANALIVPAAFTQFTGRAHWEVLLRARAIENGAYVLAPAQCGAHLHHDGSTRHCFGHSMAINPWGEIMAELSDAPDCLIVDIDPAKVDEARQNIPVLSAARTFGNPK